MKRWRAAALPPAADWLFSAKTFASAMLAYYIALASGMERPYWAVISTFIVAQPLAGAVRSKAAFRIAGTVIGAAVAVALVPNLVDAPALLILALALWVGICTYIGVLDRTPRAYLFLLAGYSAVIIGVPAAAAPDTTFTTAIVRVQEIVIGILSATAVHSLVFPRSVTTHLLNRVTVILGDAARWSRDALSDDARSVDRDSRKLAIDIHELHLLSVHLPFDTKVSALPVAALRVMQGQLSRTLPLVRALEARIGQLREMETLTDDIVRLIHDSDDWLKAPQSSETGQMEADRLITRARQLEPVWGAGAEPSWAAIVKVDLLGKLSALLDIHATGYRLQHMMQRGRMVAARDLKPALAKAERRSLHRDHAGALRAGIAGFLTVVLGNVFWILTYWPSGANAIVFATVVCALFSTSDDPAPVARRVFYGSTVSAAICAVYAFGILPAVQSFAPLAIVLAPFFLLIGVLIPRPRRNANAIGMLLAAPGLLSLDNRYTDTLGGFANAAMSQLLGTLLAVLILGLVRSIGQDDATLRLRQAGTRELSRRAAANGPPDSEGWIARMTDRVGLLAPRADGGRAISEALTDMQIGLAIDDIQRCRQRMLGRDADVLSLVLRHLARHLARRGRGATKTSMLADQRLLWTIDAALRHLSRTGPLSRQWAGILALADLRLTLAPQAPPPDMALARSAHIMTA